MIAALNMHVRDGMFFHDVFSPCKSKAKHA